MKAKTQFLWLVNAVVEGEEVIIAKAGKPIVKLFPIISKKPKYHFGLLKDKMHIAKDFNDPLPDDILSFFEK